METLTTIQNKRDASALPFGPKMPQCHYSDTRRLYSTTITRGSMPRRLKSHSTSNSPALNMAQHVQGLELDERQLPGASLDLFGVSHRVASAALFLVQAGPIPEENK